MLGSQPAMAELKIGIAPSMPAPNPRYELIERPGPKKRFEKAEYLKIPGASKEEVWTLLIQELASFSKLELSPVFLESQLEFERALSKQEFDLAYVTPLQFIQNKERGQYTALAKPKSKPHRAILVTRKDSKIRSVRDLSEQAIVYPNPLNFAASLAPRASLQSLGFNIAPFFVADELEAFRTVLDGKFPAASATQHSFNALAPNEQSELRIIWDTPGFTPDAFVANSKVPFFSQTRLQRALVALSKSEVGRRLLPLINISNGFEVAKNTDWRDVEAIDLDSLNQISEEL